ncbi:MAG TPA: SRPBCC domain-containing protein [Allosphingosinicella sp.]
MSAIALTPAGRRINNANRHRNAPRSRFCASRLSRVRRSRSVEVLAAAGGHERADPGPGGRYRIELTLEGEGHGVSGKTSERTDIASGRFLELVADRRVVQTVEFESADPAFAGTMVMTWSFDPGPEGTAVTVSASDVPRGIAADDHEAGLASTLENLANFVE